MILWGFLGQVNSAPFLGVSSGRLLEKNNLLFLEFELASVTCFTMQCGRNVVLRILRLDQKKPDSFYLCFWGTLSCHVRNLTTPRTDPEASVLWPLDMKSQLIGKDSDAGKD